ncbi:MAG: iron-containing alcohol dehydrogenase [Marinomonas foliarum]
MTHKIVLPRMLETGAGAIKKLPPMLKTIKCKKPLIVTDQVMVSLGYVDLLVKILEADGLESGLFTGTEPEPTERSLWPAMEQLQNGHFDSVVALGGGSAIDSAKAIAVLAHHGGCMSDYKVPRDVEEAGLPVIAIPTTAGTGSEVTRFTIITNEDTDEKMLCMGLAFMPYAAIVDYELTLSAPPRITADTGIDALTHGIEAYVSQKANPFSDQQALAAIALLGPNLRRAYHSPEDHEAREAMMLGSTLAGIAFSNASVALVHGMSRPIGAHFHVPHGLSNAMLLPAITRFSIPGAPKRYAQCARTMGVASTEDSDDTANEKLLAELRALNQELQVPSMANFGINKAHFMELRELMAEQALASGSPGNNPRVPSHSEIAELYIQTWNQE